MPYIAFLDGRMRGKILFLNLLMETLFRNSPATTCQHGKQALRPLVNMVKMPDFEVNAFCSNYEASDVVY